MRAFQRNVVVGTTAKASLVLLGLAGLTACSGRADDSSGYIAPFDGQTAFDPNQDLVVSLEGVRVPDDYPFEDLIQVMDLLDGGQVPGTVTLTDDELRFVPDFPWEADRRCAWTIYDPLEEPHGPEFHLPASLEGTAVFEVSANIHALDATVGEVDGQVCLLLSRPVDTAMPVTVWVEDAEFAIVADSGPDSWTDIDLAPSDGGAGVRCFDAPTGLAAGDAIRLRIEGSDDVLGQGPWRMELSDQPVDDLLAARRRANSDQMEAQ